MGRQIKEGKNLYEESDQGIMEGDGKDLISSCLLFVLHRPTKRLTYGVFDLLHPTAFPAQPKSEHTSLLSISGDVGERGAERKDVACPLPEAVTVLHVAGGRRGGHAAAVCKVLPLARLEGAVECRKERRLCTFLWRHGHEPLHHLPPLSHERRDGARNICCHIPWVEGKALDARSPWQALLQGMREHDLSEFAVCICDCRGIRRGPLQLDVFQGRQLPQDVEVRGDVYDSRVPALCQQRIHEDCQQEWRLS